MQKPCSILNNSKILHISKEFYMKKISNQKDWLNYYNNNEFDLIVKNICSRHGIACDKIEKIYCGENALFKVRNKVIKIYNPLVLSKEKQIAEVESYKRANKLNLPIPKIWATGSFEDTEICYYIIIDYISGYTLRQKNVPKEKMIELSYELKNFLTVYNTTPTEADLQLLRIDCDKFKFELVSKGLADDLKMLYKNIDLNELCYVHADLHKGNILLDKNNQFKVIDFGDAKIAPKYCELPPIICDLYHFDGNLIKNTFEIPIKKLQDQLLKGFVINDFGTDYIQDLCNFLGYGDMKNIKNIEELKCLINLAFEKGAKT